MKKWSITNVLIAGKRESGEAFGRDADEAVRRFAAVRARERGADVAVAIAGALADRYKKVTVITASGVSKEADQLLRAPEGNFTEWPGMMSESESKAALAREFLGRDDSFWNVDWTPDGGTEDRESGHSSFRKSGYSGVQCTGFACEILAKLGPERVRVYGFRGSDNPSSEVGKTSGGHDFAVVDGRFIVDPWLVEIEAMSGQGVFDLEDPLDREEILRLYGDPIKWKLARVSGSALHFD